MDQLGRMLVVAGLVLAVIGALLILGPKLGLRLGRLPLDYHFQRGNFSIYVPLGTSILLSLVVSLVLMWFSRR